MHRFVKAVQTIFFGHFLYRVTYLHEERIQQGARCLVCPNHSNVFDPTFLYPKYERMAIMAKAEVFKIKWIAYLFKKYDIFPIQREKHDTKSTIHAISILKGKEEMQLLIFPEGKVIHKNEPIGKIKQGAVYLAAKTKVPIQPIYITRRPRFFSKVYVVFRRIVGSRGRSSNE